MPWDRRRHPRRGTARPRRILVAAAGGAVAIVVLVAVVVQVGSQSLPYRRSVDLSYAALVGRLAAPSVATGQDLAALLSAAPGDQRSAVFSGLDGVAAAAERTATTARLATPPAPAVAAGMDCTTALEVRATASATVRSAVERLLGGSTGTAAGAGATSAATAALTGAGRQLQRADDLWATCRNALRHGPGLARVPPSAWMTDPAAWSAASVAALVSAIAGSPSLAAAPALAIGSVTSDPPAVSQGGGATFMLPSASALGVTVVVVDSGNVDLPHVVVEVRAQPAGPLGAGPPVRRTVDVRAGSAATVVLTGLRVTPGGTFTLVASARSDGPTGAAGVVRAADVSTTVSVAQAASSAAVTASASQLHAGGRVVYTATVSGTQAGAAPPTGTVTFEDAGTPIASCAGIRLARGTATCPVTYPTVGVHSITVVYSGTAEVAGSTSPAITETVSAAPAPQTVPGRAPASSGPGSKP